MTVCRMITFFLSHMDTIPTSAISFILQCNTVNAVRPQIIYKRETSEKIPTLCLCSGTADLRACVCVQALVWQFDCMLKLTFTKTLRITSSRCGKGKKKSANITGHIVAMGTGDGRWEDHASHQKDQFSTINTETVTFQFPPKSTAPCSFMEQPSAYCFTTMTLHSHVNVSFSSAAVFSERDHALQQADAVSDYVEHRVAHLSSSRLRTW